MTTEEGPRLRVNHGGNYRVDGNVPLKDHKGNAIETDASYWLCRCGGSATKPFCDGTHKTNNFNGQEFASKQPIAERRAAFAGAGVTIYDDRPVCSHAGFCTDHLKEVFKLKQEPWIDPRGSSKQAIIDQVRRCPSGALSYGTDSGEPVEEAQEPGITVSEDGPYWVRGVPVRSGDGDTYEPRERQTLCRCGGSRNKPFCDGTHWYIGFTHAVGRGESGA